MSGSPTWPEVALAGLSVVQVVLLTHISSRSRRFRRTDREGRHEKPQDDDEGPT